MRIPEIAALAGPGCNLDGRRLTRVADLTHTSFDGCSLRGADLRYVSASGADFSGVDLSGADLSGGTFQGALFRSATLRDVTALPALMMQADFTDADLSGARMDNAILQLSTWQGATCPDGQRAGSTSPATCEGRTGAQGPAVTLGEFTGIIVRMDPSELGTGDQ